MIPKFITKAIVCEPLVIYGDGLQAWDFVFVRDVVRANITATESGEMGVFNIGSREAVMINELAGVVVKLCGKNHEAAHVEPMDIRHSQASVERAKKIGFVPIVFKRGVEGNDGVV